jgi:hypothetical protein
MTDNTTASVARRYIDTVGSRELADLDHLLDDRLTATFAGATLDKAGWIEALHRLVPALVRNDIREVFVDGDRACVVYDFVTDTDAGAVKCVELVTVDAGQITEIELVLDRVAFAPVNAALAAR